MGVIIYYIKRNVVEWASCTLGQKWRMFLWVLLSLRRGQHWKRKYGDGISVSFLDSLQHGTNHVFVYLASTCYRPALNSKLNLASHLCIKNIIEEKTVFKLFNSF